MTIEVDCPGCFHPYRLSDDKAGRQFRCKHCAEIVTVPAAPIEDWNDSAWDDDEGDDWDEDVPARRKPQRRRSRRNRRNEGKGSIVGISMMVLAGLMMLWVLYSGITTIAAGPDPATLPPAGPQRDGYIVGYFVGSVAAVALLFAYQCAVIYGAWNLVQHRSRSWALTASILCCIPCCSPGVILCIPFGIAGIVITNQLSDAGEFDY